MPGSSFLGSLIDARPRRGVHRRFECLPRLQSRFRLGQVRPFEAGARPGVREAPRPRRLLHRRRPAADGCAALCRPAAVPRPTQAGSRDRRLDRPDGAHQRPVVREGCRREDRHGPGGHGPRPEVRHRDPGERRQRSRARDPGGPIPGPRGRERHAPEPKVVPPVPGELEVPRDRRDALRQLPALENPENRTRCRRRSRRARRRSTR